MLHSHGSQKIGALSDYVLSWEFRFQLVLLLEKYLFFFFPFLRSLLIATSHNSIVNIATALQQKRFILDGRNQFCYNGKGKNKLGLV